MNWQLVNASIPNLPHYKLSGRAFIKTPARTTFLIETAGFGERKAVDSSGEEITMPGYLVINADTKHLLNNHIALKLVLRNVFDVNYEEVYGYPAPGRQVLAGVDIRIGGVD